MNWFIQNNSPYDVVAVKTTQYGESVNLSAFPINPHTTLKLSGSAIDSDDLVSFFDASTQTQLGKGVVAKGGSRLITVVGMTYDYVGGGRSMVNPNNDISGLWFHNSLPFDIEIWLHSLQGREHIATVGAEDGRTYHTGSQASIFIDNEVTGFRLGDLIGLRVAGSGSGSDCATLKVSDTDMRNVFIENSAATSGYTPSQRPDSRYRF